MEIVQPSANSGGSGSLTVTDGITPVVNVTTIELTSGAVVTDAGGGVAEVAINGSGGVAISFETVSKNLDASGATLAYTGENLTSIAYVNGISKTLNYTGENLTSVVLSGTTPGGIDLTKTLSYTGENLTGVSYA